MFLKGKRITTSSKKVGTLTLTSLLEDLSDYHY